MRKHVKRARAKRACAAAAATVAALALAAELADLAQATPASTPAKFAESTARASGRIHQITLITGDRVAVDAKGRVVGVERAKGREHIPVQVRTVGKHTLVIPMDATRMIASGRLDRRLFDITELNKAANRKNQKNGVKVIVGYSGAARAAKAGVRDTGTLGAAFKSLNADAVLASRQNAPGLWKAVTDGNTLASGIAHVWLDGVRRASLDESVPQIGAPTAWAKGYTGKGVKVAVLDTGIDTTHPDLKSQVAESKNFTTAKDTIDHFGHGTHVASIIAGTGAKSGGKYKGVAPGASLLNAKVLDDEGGGDDSGILAGMEWAAQQGANIVNLSLGGGDTEGIDPLEAEVNELSEQKGILFAIAAGNEGEGGAETIDSPGSAADALTVGAVDGNDKLAYFSSRGPTVDGTLKPDVTAPGVNITAAAAKDSVIAKEVGENPPGYLTISGTSMATPHVAGAAAILKQEHPDWTYAQLKATLVGSSKGGDYTTFEGGAGRIQVDKAIAQSVVAEPTTLDFPVQQWPHTDDTPVTKQLTYRNSGTEDVTLTLAAKGFDPKGKAAPAGFFALGADKVTVPAGGKASVNVTVNAKLGGDLNGGYSARVSATGGGQTVSTAVGVVRETEHYNVTLKYINRAGQNPKHIASMMSIDGLGPASWLSSESTDNTSVVRVPRGKYIFESASAKDLVTYQGGLDWLIQPELNVTRNMTVTLDLNKAKSPDITVPDPAAKPKNAWLGYRYYRGQKGADGNGVFVDSFADIRVAHVGPAVDYLSQRWAGQWTSGGKSEYDIAAAASVTKLKADYVRHYKASDFATLKVGMGSSVPGKTGAVAITGAQPDGIGYWSPYADSVPQKLPSTRTYHLSAVEGAEWRPDFYQYSGKTDSDGNPVVEATSSAADYLKFKAGRTYQQRFNTAVFGPVRSSDTGITRDGNEIAGALPLFSDGAGHTGDSDFTSATTTLYRNGKKIGSLQTPIGNDKPFKVPASDGAYRLTTSVRRSAALSTVSSRVDATWTFHSKKPNLPVDLPVSTVRFNAQTGLDSTVAAGRTVTYPVTVQGAAKGSNLKSLAVWVSYDHGRTWKKVTVTHGRITVKNPAKGKSVSLRAKVVDKKNNTSTISIYDAYFGK
ncbi:S8 family serine peptidase [Streptomyces coacervatus]|uniref:S8 family serine peptidase n=1 Tax=Streptomyces coacervatus TaxID=647381 RepID=A0ABP7J9N9_9ACTN|nr:S8 family peptidase [Streptomyces coacervatus]MDF2270334.1 S8 family peptidase [Streptomyces coacervatus]